QAQRSHPVLDDPREFRQPSSKPRPGRSVHQVERLNGSPGAKAGSTKLVDGTDGDIAIGVNHNHDVNRIQSQMPNTEVESVSLAMSGWIIALNDFRPRRLRDIGSTICAVVGDNEQPVALIELRPHRFYAASEQQGLVVRRHDNRQSTALPWLLTQLTQPRMGTNSFYE